ncbi:chlorophyll a/b-binding protein domain-containing protein [Ochromonadaceae sp. CCMP2298]|nr:chlorophyll a/b-binding protein domain-containing protein [Ochromonadaceae sp. CCMP2298]
MRVFILSALLCAAHAFQTPMPLTRRLALSPLASTPETTPTPTTPPISMTPKERFAPRQAKWFPMLLSPAALDGSYAGDVGFDPLGFAKDEESFLRMREAELKHARLAMLAAAGWPLSELWHQGIAQVLGLDSILADADRAPSVLNGGLMNEWIVGTGVAALVVGALLEFKGFQSKGKRAGDLGFDPLSLHKFRASFGLDPITEQITAEEKMRRAKFDMELAEIKNGRLAMIAITGYAAQEWVTGIPVVQQTPFFFGDPIL